MRRELSCSPLTELKTTWCVPLSGLVAQLPAASAAAQMATANVRRVANRRMANLLVGPRPCGDYRTPGNVRARCARLLGARGGRVLAAELVDPPGGIADLLLAGIERMAVRAHLDLQIMTERRARLERVAARAGDGDLFVPGVDFRFHGRLGAWQAGVAGKWGGRGAN